MNTKTAERRIEPSHKLFDASRPLNDPAFVSVHSDRTNLRAQWATFFAEHLKPVTPESYQRDTIAEAQARHILGND